MGKLKELRMNVQYIMNVLSSNGEQKAVETFESVLESLGFRSVLQVSTRPETITHIHNGDVREIEVPKIPVPELGTTLLTVGQVRGIMSELDDHDHVCVEACDEHGDVEDLYPMSMDVIEGIELVDKTIVREVRFCQRPNTEPDTRPKQPVVDALIDVLADDIAKGDTTVLDELLLRMPFDVLKYCLPEDMWADFEENVQPDNLKL